MKEEKKTKFKLEKNQIWSGAVLLAIVIAIMVLYFIGKNKGWFSMFDSVEELQEFVSGYGVWAPLIFFLLQVVQVILAPVPGSVTTLFGGVFFGFWKAMIISVAAVFTGSMILFLMAKYLGKPLVTRLIGEERVEKYMKNMSARQFWVLFMMFMMPFFPDDVLCLMAGLTAIRLPGFALMVLVTRPWGLIFSALVGSGVITVPIWGWVIIGLISAFLLFVSIRYPEKLEEWMSDKVLNILRKKSRN
ncbi:MAG: TVP38/TMEM64 family protein [Clostridia bacterium]|nr:TVP38/TMEM64 family protein [Clostridia bacterium]MBN2882932.1 TVP38/TMEM64 family protein [Clostridia bacterium]